MKCESSSFQSDDIAYIYCDIPLEGIVNPVKCRCFLQKCKTTFKKSLWRPANHGGANFVLVYQKTPLEPCCGQEICQRALRNEHVSVRTVRPERPCMFVVFMELPVLQFSLHFLTKIPTFLSFQLVKICICWEKLNSFHLLLLKKGLFFCLF